VQWKSTRFDGSARFSIVSHVFISTFAHFLAALEIYFEWHSYFIHHLERRVIITSTRLTLLLSPWDDLSVAHVNLCILCLLLKDPNTHNHGSFTTLT
jgi:hypothetical protein